MTIRRLTTFALTGALGLTSLVGAAGAAHADPVDYVQIRLVDLYCGDESEGDHDEAYLNIAANGGKAVKLWPAKASYQTMGTGYRRTLDESNGNALLVLGKNESRTLSLWDYDSTSSDDRLGSVTITGNEFGAETQYRVLEGSGGVYTIAYQVIDI
ncbi:MULTISPECIES: hypothetical protein [unclassified Streptomyces]|uniref:hypothetical protein n=1 Tax=unclassified Streptomyces TaxID=2593676 RepID=UPI00089A3D67|nr:hypothetical protein [Streptomyces sp. 2131.1]SEB66413.1 hypothetical protein SAMN05216483_0153 [Streptomyces sp. 2131.1]